MKILIIEDDSLIRQTLQDMLELNGHRTLAAGTGAEGIRFAAQRPDVILCDIGLPDTDGYEVIREIQALHECRDIPFIFLTARAGREDQRHGMELGADDYISKPFTEREILDAVSARVRRQRPLRERIERLMEERSHAFSAQWSHELLTPLNGILGSLALLEAEAELTEKAQMREMLGLIRSGAERQLRLALKLVRHFEMEGLRDGRILPEPASCFSDVAVAAGVARAELDEQRPGSVIVKCRACELPLAESYLSNAVSELVSNGLRFSDPSDPVILNGLVSNGLYRIEVLDHGPGMPPGQRDRIGAFVQFDTANGRRQGLGLGLAICSATAAVAGGRLLLEDGPSGWGLNAVLELPLKQLARR